RTSAATASTKKSRGSATAFTIPLMKPMSTPSSKSEVRSTKPDRRLTSKFVLSHFVLQTSYLQRSRNPSVLAYAPEMNRHQHGNDQRQADAVQHVESQQRAFADERAAEQREPRVVGRVNQRDVAQPRSEEHTSELQSRENLVCR